MVRVVVVGGVVGGRKVTAAAGRLGARAVGRVVRVLVDARRHGVRQGDASQHGVGGVDGHRIDACRVWRGGVWLHDSSSVSSLFLPTVYLFLSVFSVLFSAAALLSKEVGGGAGGGAECGVCRGTCRVWLSGSPKEQGDKRKRPRGGRRAEDPDEPQVGQCHPTTGGWFGLVWMKVRVGDAASSSEGEGRGEDESERKKKKEKKRKRMGRLEVQKVTDKDRLKDG